MSDRSKLWLLNAIVTFSSILIGLPLANTLAFILAPIALIILTVRYRYAFVVMPIIMAMSIAIVLYGAPVALAYFYLVILPGVIMGYKARAFSTPRAIGLWGFAPFAILTVVIIALYSRMMAQSPAFIADFLNVLSDSAAQMGIVGGQLDSLLEFWQKAMEMMLRLLPGIVFTFAAAFVLFVYMGATSFARHFGAVIPNMTPTYFWRISELWLIPLGLSMLLVLIGGESLRIAGENLLVFFIHFYAFFGICLIDFYLSRLNIPTVARIIIYFVILIPGITIFLLALFGIIDSRFDFRKLAFENEN